MGAGLFVEETLVELLGSEELDVLLTFMSRSRDRLSKLELGLLACRQVEDVLAQLTELKSLTVGLDKKYVKMMQGLNIFEKLHEVYSISQD